MKFYRPLHRQPEHTTSAWSDILAVFRQKVEHRWAFVLASIAIPAATVLAFMSQYNKKADYKPPEVIFVKDWRAGRSDAEIKRQQAIDAPVEREQRRLEREAEERRKAQFRKLADEMGIDVDK